MDGTYGIIFLDGYEISCYLYKLQQNVWVLEKEKHHNLTPFPQKELITSADIVEILAYELQAPWAIHTSQWNLLGKNIAKHIVTEVANALHISAIPLTYEREHDLLCKGVLLENNTRVSHPLL